jgi:hypothetical protein
MTTITDIHWEEFKAEMQDKEDEQMQMKCAIIDALPKQVELIYADYRDEIHDVDLIRGLLFGNGEKVLDVEEELQGEWYEEARYLNAKEVIREAVRDAGIEESEVPMEMFDEVMQEVMDRDVNTYLQDLIRNTGDVTLRIPLGIELRYGAEEGDVEEAVKGLRSLGLNVTAEEVERLLADSAGGGEMEVIFTVSMAKMWKATEATRWGHGGCIEVKVESPHVLLWDQTYGNGWQMEMEGLFQGRFGREEIELDAGKWSYTEGVCGGGVQVNEGDVWGVGSDGKVKG